jgi:PH (Pleckstrin Homology) domain-containing protein
MQAQLSRSIPAWVPETVENAIGRRRVRHSQIIESPRSARWDVIVELEDGTEVLAWVDTDHQTPQGVAAVLRQALRDAGID